MPAGFNQQPFQYSRPPHGSPRPHPTPSRNQNAGGVQDLGGGQPSTLRPIQPPPTVRKTPSQPQPPGLANPAASPTGAQNQPNSAPNIAEFEFGGQYFKNLGQVKAHIQELAWMPSMGAYGLPKTLAERKYYLDVLKTAIASTADVWDRNTSPHDFNKFTPYVVGDQVLNGEWTGPKDVEAAATFLLTTAMSMHSRGVFGSRFLRSSDYTPHFNEDVDFTFTQRIHFVAWLLEHSKTAAALVMAIQSIEKFLAIPFTTLLTFRNFSEEWMTMSADERRQFQEVVPYQDIETKHPTEQQQTQLRQRSQALFRELKAREASFPDVKAKAEFDAREAAASWSLFGGQSAALAGSPMCHGHGQGQFQGQTGIQNSNSPHLGSSARPRNSSSPDGRTTQPYGGGSPAPRGPPNQAQQYSGGPHGFQGQPGQYGNFGGDGQGEEDEL
jgi:hypothetical protein